MGYQFGIDTPNSPPHPSFRYDTLDEAKKAARDAIDFKCHRFDQDGGGGVTIQTGPGTIIKVVSEEHLAAQDPPLAAYNWALIVQMGGAQMPLGFNNEAAMSAAVKNAVDTGELYHCGKDGHEYTYIQTTPGFVYLEMTKSQFLDNQHRLAVAMQQKKAEEDAKVPRILPAR